MSAQTQRSPNVSTLGILISALWLTLTPFAASADVRSDAMSALEMWSPTAVNFSNGTLTVNLPQQRITEDIYIAVLSFGLCLGTLTGKDFSNVGEFVVLNHRGSQGFVYERGASDCDAVLDVELRSIKDQRLHILGATHWH